MLIARMLNLYNISKLYLKNDTNLYVHAVRCGVHVRMEPDSYYTTRTTCMVVHDIVYILIHMLNTHALYLKDYNILVRV